MIFQYSFHFIGIQETMICDCDDRILRRFDPQQDYLWLCNPAKGRSRGILAGVRKEFYDVGSFQQGDHMLQMNLWDKVNKIKWIFLVVYGAAQDEHKIEFLSELSAFCSTNKDPILIGGDFNIIIYAKERNKEKEVQRYSGMFNTLINFHERQKIVMSSGLYT
jgi:exonuclease III